jgi:drug/metabolite transporter (DMT)-like permease
VIIAFLQGFIGIGIEANLYFQSLKYLNTSLTSVLFYTYPIFVALFGYLGAKEKIDRKTMGALGLSFIGGCLVSGLFDSSPGSPAAERIPLIGVFFALATSVIYAVYMRLGHWMTQGASGFEVSKWIVLGSALSFFIQIPLVLHTWIPKVPEGPTEWGIMFGIGVFATVIAFAFLYAGMEQLSPIKTALLSMMEAVFAIILGLIFFRDQLTVVQMMGGILLLGASLWVQIPSSFYTIPRRAKTVSKT